jgi:NAD(P)-dependent dehydrogenase (short-subunit alcohol dehydrogenase family)
VKTYSQKQTAELRQTSPSAWSVTADVATAAGRAATLKQAIGALGGLDILVNNAGGVRAGRLENTPEVARDGEARAQMIAVNRDNPAPLTNASSE